MCVVVLLSSKKPSDNNSVRPDIRVLQRVYLDPFDPQPKALKVVVTTNHFHLNDVDAQVRDGLFGILQGDIDRDIANVEVGRQISTTPGDETVDNLFADDQV